MRAMNGQRTGRWPKSAMGIRSPPMIPASSRTCVYGSARNASSRPSSCMTSSVEGWIVSPRKSRRKSACFSRTSTSTPVRANSSPSMIPAGPPPAMQHRTETLSTAIVALRYLLSLVPAMQKGNLQEQHEAIEGEEGSQAGQAEAEKEQRERGRQNGNGCHHNGNLQEHFRVVEVRVLGPVEIPLLLQLLGFLLNLLLLGVVPLLFVCELCLQLLEFLSCRGFHGVAAFGEVRLQAQLLDAILVLPEHLGLIER